MRQWRRGIRRFAAAGGPIAGLLAGLMLSHCVHAEDNRLSLAPGGSAESESVYAPPEPPTSDEGTNNGGVDTDVDFHYLTDYVYRGVSHNRAVGGGNIHASNFQVDARLSFDLGKLPHPYVGAFANINDSDPVSRFQEVRPFAGVVYSLRPLAFDVGFNAYLYPERERLRPSPNTSEFFLKITFDDSYIALTRRPILAPYVYAAYDYQRNNGFYIEAGVKHDFVFEDFGFTLTPYGDVAFVSNFARQFITVSPQDSGFQHYDLGLTANYSLNNLLHLPPRVGQFAIEGYLNYTGKFSNAVLANTELWGGVGLAFHY